MTFTNEDTRRLFEASGLVDILPSIDELTRFANLAAAEALESFAKQQIHMGEWEGSWQVKEITSRLLTTLSQYRAAAQLNHKEK